MVPCRAIRGNSIPVDSTLPPLGRGTSAAIASPRPLSRVCRMFDWDRRTPPRVQSWRFAQLRPAPDLDHSTITASYLICPAISVPLYLYMYLSLSLSISLQLSGSLSLYLFKHVRLSVSLSFHPSIM